MWKFASDTIALAAIVIMGIAVLVSTPSWGASLPPYTPGGAPCNGACTYEWAREQANAPEGAPHSMMIPAGSIVVGMSYAKDGKAIWTDRHAYLTQDEPGIGYWFERDGQRLLMARIYECQNWAVFLPPLKSARFSEPDRVAARTDRLETVRAPRWPPGFTALPPRPGRPQAPPEAGPEPPEAIAPVPVPASVLGLLAGLLGLVWVRSRA